MHKIGITKFDGGKPVVWTPDETINPHWLILGVSGSGKTYNIMRLLNGAAMGLRCFVFDVHGDIETSLGITSTVEFSNSSPYGFNPLIINPDSEYGGVNRRIRSFTSMVDKYCFRLGINQEAALRNLLLDLYSANHIYQDQVASWGNTKQPTLADLKRFTNAKIKTVLFGLDSKTGSALGKLNRATAALSRKSKENNIGSTEEVEGLKKEVINLFTEYISNIKTGREMDDYIKYDSKDTMKSLFNRIEKLESLCIFKDHTPAFNRSAPIWRYDCRSLTDEEQGFLVEMYLEKIFLHQKQLGPSKTLRTLIVLDEAHKFISEDPSHIINIMMRESRKFGIGLVMASHHLAHFSEDIIINCATKLLLGIDEVHQESISRKLGIELKRLRYIQPRKTALVQMKSNKEYSGNRFVDVLL